MAYYIENDELRIEGEPAAVITKEAFLLCYEEWVNKPQKSRVKRGRKTTIDWDKACALKQAGWKNKDIAEELEASEKTIAVYIKAHLEEYVLGKRFSKTK